MPGLKVLPKRRRIDLLDVLIMTPSQKALASRTVHYALGSRGAHQRRSLALVVTSPDAQINLCFRAMMSEPAEALAGDDGFLNRSLWKKDRSHARVSPHSAESSTAFYRQQ
jgi:hypothetical protein